ncbi:peptidoglycan bridge formation glycyltransferase FemA/FemB family protein [Candidatus Saccharibacteria bacterium]|nr:peptidoglycan bridge formation glycyltransferase FemA/FemB family protein [Candidatus Saccharibacteria bacterium]MCB9821707.1 peptidoglycan bridge formation glycyltransferase FemA/FemB family protein [Candidatus Nomurabacteria bacterium]
MIDLKDITDESIWQEFVQGFEEVNFLHSWQWGEFHKARYKKVIRRGIYDDEVLVGVYTGQVEDARRGRYLAIAGGPLLKNWADAKRVFKDIYQQADQLGCVFARVRPQLRLSPENLKIFSDNGLRPAPMPLSVEHAGIIDLAKSDDQILADMSQSLRRKIRKAQRSDIKIEVSDNLEILQDFIQIHNQHAKRQGYVAFSPEFITKQFEAFKNTGNILIYTARHDDQILAQNYVIFYGPEASYHYGVSTFEGMKLSSAPLLHLEAMAEARRRGCKRYNFWGIVDEDQTSHRYYGVSQFKRSFGVEELKYIPAHDLVVRRAAYAKNWLIETARRKIRKL